MVEPAPCCMDHREHYRLDAELFDYADTSDRLSADFDRRLHSGILRKLQGGGILADVGSGDGWVSSFLAGKRFQVIHFDLSHANLRRIVERRGDVNGPAAAVADAYSIPLRGGAADAVILSEVLEHLEDPARAIRETARLLKPGGRLLIAAPYREKIRYYLCIHCNRMTPANAHLHSFDDEKLGALLDDGGFDVASRSLIGCRLFLVTRASYLLRWLPFGVWRLFDRAFGLAAGKFMNIVVSARRR